MVKHLWKKLVVGALFGVLICANCAYAASISSSMRHVTTLILGENGKQPLYDSTIFRTIRFYADYDRPMTDADKTTVGSLKIENGTYTYEDADGKLQDVDNATKTFDVRFMDGDESYVSFGPGWENGRVFDFLKKADGGLQGKTYTWSIGADSFTGKVYNFRTTQQQLDTYVPFVELNDNAVTWKMISVKNPSQAIQIPYSSEYRIEVSYKNAGSTRSQWEKFNSNTVHSGSYTLPSGVNKQMISRVDVHMRKDETGNNQPLQYRWYFWIGEKSDVGIKLTPIELKAGEVKTLSFTFNSGYSVGNILQPNPVIVGREDASVISLEDYKIENDVLTLNLKGLKAGNSNLAVAYRNANGDVYYTNSVTVSVIADPAAPITPAPEPGVVEKPFNTEANNFLAGPEHNSSITFKRLSVNGEIEIIAAYRPEISKKPIMFAIHGGGARKENELRTLEWHASNGFFAIAPDVAAHGDSMKGPLLNMDAWLETVGYIDTLIEYCQTLDNVDASKFAVGGGSMGGSVSLLYGAYGKYKPKVLLPELAAPDFTQILNGRANAIMDKGNTVRVESPENVMKKASDLSPTNHLQKFLGIPMYARFGELDYENGIEGAKEFIKKLKNAGETLQVLSVVPGGGHGGFSNDGQARMSYIKAHIADEDNNDKDTGSGGGCNVGYSLIGISLMAFILSKYRI